MHPTSREARRTRARIKRRRNALLTRYAAAQYRVDEELAEHPVEAIERASDQWDARVTGLLGEADVRKLTELDLALHRLERGDYSRCVTCGGPIGAARLHALPAATRCAHCAAYVERRKGFAVRR